MRIELRVQRTHLPQNGVALITAELDKRIQRVFPGAIIRVRAGNSYQLDVYARKEQKALAHSIIEQAFNEANDWLTTET